MINVSFLAWVIVKQCLMQFPVLALPSNFLLNFVNSMQLFVFAPLPGEANAFALALRFASRV